MDPKTCLENIIEHIRGGEFEDANYSADNLWEWLSQGGFEPNPELVREAAKTIADKMECLDGYPSLQWLVEVGGSNESS
tara:strand:+ start:244 stop:480 length:237 start_codon:yes stop_codon:yes gene_type:complete